MKSVAAVPLSDDLLVSQARQGDPDAFGRLIAPRADQLLRTACAILGQEAEARDAAQETLIAAWINLPGLRDASRFDAWLNRILLNQCRDALRRRKRSREVQVEVFEHSSPDLAEASSDAAAVLRAFDRIGLADRHLLVLHHLHGMPLTELAAQLGVPVGTTKSRLWSARQALERALEAEA